MLYSCPGPVFRSCNTSAAAEETRIERLSLFVMELHVYVPDKVKSNGQRMHDSTKYSNGLHFIPKFEIFLPFLENIFQNKKFKKSDCSGFPDSLIRSKFFDFFIWNHFLLFCFESFLQTYLLHLERQLHLFLKFLPLKLGIPGDCVRNHQKLSSNGSVTVVTSGATNFLASVKLLQFHICSRA